MEATKFLRTTWWLVLLQGLALLLFGLFAVIWPGLTLGALVVGFAVYLVVAGVINIISTLSGMSYLPLWFLRLVLAALEVGVGVYALRHLEMTAVTLVLLIGLVFIIRGILEVVSAMGDGFDGRHRSLTAILGVLGVVAGAVVWLYPGAAGLAFVWVLGIYGIVGGAFLMALAFEAQRLVKEKA